MRKPHVRCSLFSYILKITPIWHHKSAHSHALLYANDVGSISFVGPSLESQKYWHLLIVESLVLNYPVRLPHI